MAKRKRTKDKLWSAKHYTQNAKERVTWTPLKNGGELRYSGNISCSWSTIGTRHVTRHIMSNGDVAYETDTTW